MRAKDKKIKIRITLKNIIYFIAGIIILFYIYTFYHLYFGQNISYAKDNSQEVASKPEEVRISQANDINIDEIINQNSKPGYREEITQHEEVLEYLTTYKTNTQIPKGVSYVVQEGRKGTQKVTTKKIYQDDELIGEEQVGAVITKAALNKVVEIGGGKTTSNKKIKAGDTVYVTSDMLAVMSESNEESKKLATLQTNEELKVLEIIDNWYRISHNSVTGWVKQECTTYINPNETNVEKDENKGTSGQNNSSNNNNNQIQKLSFDMALNKPSGLSLEQFKKILSDDKDKNNVFENNAEYFYYIEQQYHINGVFVAAVGIHESAWGTSNISKQKYNLFGYGAYDSNPYNGAYSFSDYSESIDLIARVFVKYYLNPKGTNIYGGEVAVGTYYSSPTLQGVNNKYASDKNWANSVYKHMQYLYNKL